MVVVLLWELGLHSDVSNMAVFLCFVTPVIPQRIQSVIPCDKNNNLQTTEMIQWLTNNE